MTSNNNTKGKRIHKQRLLDNLMGVNGICDRYYQLKTYYGKTEIVFDISDIVKPVQEMGFGIKGFGKSHLVELPND